MKEFFFINTNFPGELKLVLGCVNQHCFYFGGVGELVTVTMLMETNFAVTVRIILFHVTVKSVSNFSFFCHFKYFPWYQTGAKDLFWLQTW